MTRMHSTLSQDHNRQKPESYGKVCARVFPAVVRMPLLRLDRAPGYSDRNHLLEKNAMSLLCDV